MRLRKCIGCQRVKSCLLKIFSLICYHCLVVATVKILGKANFPKNGRGLHLNLWIQKKKPQFLTLQENFIYNCNISNEIYF